MSDCASGYREDPSPNQEKYVSFFCGEKNYRIYTEKKHYRVFVKDASTDKYFRIGGEKMEKVILKWKQEG